MTSICNAFSNLSVEEELPNKELMQHPLCLVKNDEKGQLRVNKSTVEILQKLNTPVVVVSIAGTYRLGKSYLMNLMAGKKKGFELGSTIQARTKGIWIWCRPHPTLAGVTLILIDTEGLDDIEKGDENNDMHILILTMLLSSTFMYNTTGRLDNTLINQLSFVSELTKYIRVRVDDKKKREIAETDVPNDQDFDIYFPTLVVIVRDFYLELEINGKTVSANDYFNRYLELKKESEVKNELKERQIAKYNEPRIKIRKYFPSTKRHCCILPFPTMKQEDLANLANIPNEEMKPEFISESIKFQKLIIDISQIKSFGLCEKVNGRMLADMTHCYVKALQSGEIPCIQSALRMTALQENRRISEECLQNYNTAMERLKFPITLDELNSAHKQISEQLTKKFKTAVIFEEMDDEFANEFEGKVALAFKSVVTRNETTSTNTCQNLLENLNGIIGGKLNRNEYMKPGGYQVYTADLEKLKTSYSQTQNKGVMSSQVLTEFLERKTTEMNSVMATDRQMTENQRKEEAARRQKEEALQKARDLAAQLERSREEERKLNETIQRLKGGYTLNGEPFGISFPDYAPGQVIEIETATEAKFIDPSGNIILHIIK